MPKPDGLTLVLWPSPGRLFERHLLGRPLWQWTAEALRPLRPRRQMVLVPRGQAADLPTPFEAVTPDRLAGVLTRSRSALLLAAELPCLTPRSLKPLTALSRRGAHYLEAPNGAGETSGPLVLCGPGERLGPVFSGEKSLLELAEIARRAQAAPADLPRGGADDWVLVKTAADSARAAEVLRARKLEALSRAGVVVDEPASVQIDPQVRVGSGTRIRRFVIIEGESELGAGCDIGSFTHIQDSVLAAGAVVLDHCFIRSSRIGRRAQLGPFAHLRPESVVGDEAKVGNFVELKKSRLGRGSKAPHLSYLGDATVGRKVNVGAGTITCNYDGQHKHQTVIEDGAFIGSDVQLVAPVRVGRGAYVAAGSCVVEDVPAGALALARSRQVTKRGWAKRKARRRAARKGRS
jgi:acetyltransferase-like isoleucine patch superfamily enzyme